VSLLVKLHWSVNATHVRACAHMQRNKLASK